MDERRLEMKVGALVLAAVLGIVGLLWLMGELRLGRATELPVDFAHTGNVVKGAPVKLGGVQVGRVDDIRLLPDRRDERGAPLPVQMVLDVTPEARAALHRDATVMVATVGPLGEPYLELVPGSASAEGLAPGAAVRGTDAPRLEVVFHQIARFLDAVNGGLERDPELIGNLATNVSRLAGTLDALLTENRGDLRALTGDLSATAKDLRQLAQTARTAFQPGGTGARLLDDAAATASLMRRELPGLTRSAGQTLDGLSAVTGQFTPEDGQKLRAALERYAAAGEKLEQLAGRADRVLAQIEAGDGTIGALQKDPALYNELRTLVTDLRKNPWKILWKD
ncbi:MlaD family protein [Myxococcaceae bacterium GXIMD 01537]